MMSLMSQLPGGDVSSSDSSEDVEETKDQVEKNGLDLVSPLASETNGNSKKDSSI